MKVDLDLKRAAELCSGVAHVMANAGMLGYSGQASEEIRLHDERLSDDDVQNPVKFAHELGSCYIQAAGDFVCGMGVLADPYWNLAMSPASLARSACEYAAISWKLSNPLLSAEERVALAVACVRFDLNQPGNAGEHGEGGDLIIERTERWVSKQAFKVPGGFPDKSPLQEEMFPGNGKKDYKELSGLAHPRLTTLLKIIGSVDQGLVNQPDGTWKQSLIACSRGLRAAARLAKIRDGDPDHLNDITTLYNHYATALGQPNV